MTIRQAEAETWIPSEPDVMEITGRLDCGTAPSIEEDAMLCIQSGTRRMLFDCRDLVYVTGAGVRAILNLARIMQLHDGRFALCEVQPQVREMLERSGLDVFVPIYNNRDDAIAAIGI